MKMNLLEQMAMNSPIRFFIQRQIEAPLLKKLGANVEGLDVLEVGCAHGGWNGDNLKSMERKESVCFRAERELAKEW